MASYSTNEFRSGLRILIDNDPCVIVENEFVKPGKGQAFNRVKIRNLKTGKVVDKTFKSGESVEAADVVESIFEVIKRRLEDGEKVKVSGFGNFVINEKRPRKGRNPQTGEEIIISGRRVLTFKPSQVLKRTINLSTPPEASASSDGISS